MPHPGRGQKNKNPCDRRAKDAGLETNQMRETYQNGARLEQTEENHAQEVFLYSTDNSKLLVSILLEVAILTTCKMECKGEHERHRSVQKGGPGLYQGWDQQRLTRDKIWNVLCN